MSNKNKSVSIYPGAGRDIDVVPVTILNDISQHLANSIASGPQDELFKLIEDLNEYLSRFDNRNSYINEHDSRYTQEIPSVYVDVTKGWNWKAGSIPRMKEAMAELLGMGSKAKKLSLMLRRINDYSNWRLRHVTEKITKIENTKTYLKRNGFSYDVDIDAFKVRVKDFASKITDECVKMEEFGKGHIKVQPWLHIEGDKERYSNLYLLVTLSGLTMKIFHNDSLLQELPLNNINIIFKSNLRKFLRNLENPSSSLRDVQFSGLYDSPLIDGYETSYRNSRLFNHPYIQGASYNRETERFNYNYCCFDSYIDDIKKSFHSLNFELLSMNLLNWATYYNINHSNPYWKPNYLHLGIPENFNDNYEYIDSRTNIIDSCKTRTSRYFGVSIQDQFSPSWIETYDIALDNCMNVKCKEKDKCSFFKTGNHDLTKLNSFDDSANIREQLESILGHILYIECYGDYELFAEFLIEHNYHIFPNRISSFLSSFKSIDDIINALIMSNFYNEELNLLSFGYNMLNNSRYWLEEKEEDKEMITNDDIKEQMLQWATERSR